MTAFEPENVDVLGDEILRARRDCVEAMAALRIAESAAEMAREALAQGTGEQGPTPAQLGEAREVLRNARLLVRAAREKLAHAERAFDEELLWRLARRCAAASN